MRGDVDIAPHDDAYDNARDDSKAFLPPALNPPFDMDVKRRYEGANNVSRPSMIFPAFSYSLFDTFFRIIYTACTMSGEAFSTACCTAAHTFAFLIHQE
jgi:hypothetical protein